MADAAAASEARGGTGSPLEVLLVFLKLGVSSFGGPIAHVGYFRNEFVVRRRWLGAGAFADLVSLCQFLPGPASSQVGFSIGLIRAGWLGALAAWAGFTLPSALAMTAFAFGVRALGGPLGLGLLHGLRLAAVAIVAQAVWGMARTSAADRIGASIAAVAAVANLLAQGPAAQLGSLAVGGLVGFCLCRGTAAAAEGEVKATVSRTLGVVAVALYLLILIGLPVARSVSNAPDLALFEAFYRSGALVFGGGHVVLPLLRQAVVTPGWVDDGAFLAGYGAAQALPGPLFTFAAYLGAVAKPAPTPLAGAAIGLVGIFLPGLLILTGALPFWNDLRRRTGAQSVMRGVNAAVVGLLGAALYNPVWTTSVTRPLDAAVASVGFVLLTAWRAPPIAVVAFGAFCGAILG